MLFLNRFIFGFLTIKIIPLADQYTPKETEFKWWTSKMAGFCDKLEAPHWVFSHCSMHKPNSYIDSHRQKYNEMCFLLPKITKDQKI